MYYKKVKFYLKDFDFNIIKSNIRIISSIDAMLISITHIDLVINILSIVGNVLRDYLTNLFSIIEAGTSANVFSIINLIEEKNYLK